jgi:signal transduction histidine kinase
VKARKKNKMRVGKFPDNLICSFSKNTEGQFNNSGALYCQAIEHADGVPFQLIFGPRSGEGYYLTVGSGIRQLLGISSEEFTEKAFNEMIDEVIPITDDMPSELSESRKKFINGELKSYKAEILIRMPGGEKKWIQDTSLPLVDEETGKVIGAFGILFDINERKQMLRHLEEAKERAEENDRLKSAFLHNISHEIRTPLNAIVGFSAILTDAENDPGVRQKYIDIIFSSSDHLLEIFDDIVEISEIESGIVKIRKEEVNINSRLRKVYDRFISITGEKNISLSIVKALEDHGANIITDGYKLSQILSNLVSNAIKFTKNGEVEFGYSIKNNKVEFYVSDTGIGIPKEHHEMIFSNFYQADSSNTRRYEGTGLGLSISKAYIELLGGEIRFTSQPGEGSVFYFTLPYDKVRG